MAIKIKLLNFFTVGLVKKLKFKGFAEQKAKFIHLNNWMIQNQIEVHLLEKQLPIHLIFVVPYRQL